jgi:hypothetical protein
MNRIESEKRTVGMMIRLYCRSRNRGKNVASILAEKGYQVLDPDSEAW